MEDRGDKIITLAREMLRSNVTVEPAMPSHSISLRVLCLATCLTAASSTLVTSWAVEQTRPLTRYEKIELEALLFYASHGKGMDEAALRKSLEAKLGIANFDDMTEGEFHRARLYLQSKLL